MKPTTLLALMLFASTALAADLPRVYVEAAETVDASNAKNKAKQVDFGAAITGALVKKKVPVLLVTDPSKSEWTIKATSSQKEDSKTTKAVKIAVLGVFAGGFTKFEGTLQVIDNESSAVIYAYNVKKGNFKKSAEKFAGDFKDKFLKKYLKSRRVAGSLASAGLRRLHRRLPENQPPRPRAGLGEKHPVPRYAAAHQRPHRQRAHDVSKRVRPAPQRTHDRGAVVRILGGLGAHHFWMGQFRKRTT